MSAEQHTDLSPELERLDEMIIRSSLGDRPPEIHYRWNPLWQMSEAQKADIALKKAQATQIYITTNAVPEEVMGVAVRNQLQEDGTYPGIDAAFDDYDAGLLTPEPDEDDDPNAANDDEDDQRLASISPEDLRQLFATDMLPG